MYHSPVPRPLPCSSLWAASPARTGSGVEAGAAQELVGGEAVVPDGELQGPLAQLAQANVLVGEGAAPARARGALHHRRLLLAVLPVRQEVTVGEGRGLVVCFRHSRVSIGVQMAAQDERRHRPSTVRSFWFGWV